MCMSAIDLKVTTGKIAGKHNRPDSTAVYQRGFVPQVSHVRAVSGLLHRVHPVLPETQA